MPRRALKAGSARPPLARKTALTTAASIVGNASFSVFSACCSGANGRGGFGGATSSPEPGWVAVDDGGGFGGGTCVCVGSSSKSKAFAVVGDSGRGSSFYNMVSRLPLNVYLWLTQHTGFSGSDIVDGSRYEFKYGVI